MLLFINESCLVGAAFNMHVCYIHPGRQRIYDAGCILIVSCFIYFGVLCTMMRSGVCLTLTHESMTGFYLVGALQATFLLEGHQSLQ